ncbi:MAG TPA: Ig-like domain-containing protein [Thermoanaerobaculia bacterium]|nr:Ig-like domain-containing protein [Thermoanaerobaculia bacterium]
MRSRTLRAIFAGLLLAGAPAAVFAEVIDSFTTNQAAVVDPGAVPTVVTGGADILGTRRALNADILAGAGPTTVAVTAGLLTFTVAATTPDSRGEAIVTWDGDTTAGNLNHTGLAGANLADSGHTSFRFTVTMAPAGTELVLEVYTDAANASRGAIRLPAVAASTNFYLSYASDFVPFLGTGADFSDVGAIRLYARGTETPNLSIDLIDTVGATLGATKVDLTTGDVPITAPVAPGTTVKYRVTITNTSGEARQIDFDDTIDVNTALVPGSIDTTPVALDDAYEAFGNVSKSIALAQGLLANDRDPDGTGGLTVDTSGSPVTTVLGGTATLAANGSFTYEPPLGLGRTVDSFNYTVMDGEGNTDTGEVTIHLGARIWFVDDAHGGTNQGTLANPFIGITATNVGGAGGAGDVDAAGDILFLFEGGHAAIELEADQQLIGEGEGLVLGGETIVPAGVHPSISTGVAHGIVLAANNRIRGVNVGNSVGADLFGNAFGTLDLDNVTLSGTGQALNLTNGVANADFTSITSTSSASHGISLDGVTGTVTSGSTSISGASGTGIRILNGGSTYTFGPTTVNAASGVSVTASATSTVNFSSLAVTATNGAGLVGNTVGAINIGGASNTVTATNGAAVDLTSVSLGAGATFTTVSSSTSAGKGVNLDGVTGSFVATGGAISGSTGNAFDVNAGGSTITYGGSISHAGAARLVEITNRTGAGATVTLSGNLNATSGTGIFLQNNHTANAGTFTFSGSTKAVNTGANAAVTLDNNDMATINFNSGGLDIDTTSGTGFAAINGAAAINVMGAVNTITSTTGTALNVANSNIGASGMTFQSIASNGATSGIVLNSTGTSGGLTVTGTGGAGSGGTINNSTGPGIHLTTTRTISLTSVNVTNGGDDGIRGSSVTGLSLASVQVTANGNAAGEAGMDLSNLLGTSTWSNVTVSGSAEDNVVIRNNSGTLNGLTVTGGSFSSNSSIGNDGFLVESSGTASMTVSVTGSSFSASRGDHFQASAANSGVLDVVFSGNTLSGGHATALGQGITISAATGVPGFAGTVDYNIDNNVINGAILSAITANLGTSAAGSNMRGTISGNTIGTAATFQSGSTQASGITVEAHGNGTHTMSVTNNTIRQTFDRGINVLANDGGGTLNMTVTGNNSSHSDGTNSREGFFLNNGSADPNIFGVPDAHFVCLSLGGAGVLRNTLTHGPGAPDDFRLRQRFNSTIRLPGYGGAATDTAAVVTFVNGNNISTTGSATVNSPPGGGFVGGAACPLPP